MVAGFLGAVAPKQRCGKEGDRKGRGKPLARTKGFSSPLHDTLTTLQFIARLKKGLGAMPLKNRDIHTRPSGHV